MPNIVVDFRHSDGGNWCKIYAFTILGGFQILDTVDFYFYFYFILYLKQMKSERGNIQRPG